MVLKAKYILPEKRGEIIRKWYLCIQNMLHVEGNVLTLHKRALQLCLGKRLRSNIMQLTVKETYYANIMKLFIFFVIFGILNLYHTYAGVIACLVATFVMPPRAHSLRHSVIVIMTTH